MTAPPRKKESRTANAAPVEKTYDNGTVARSSRIDKSQLLGGDFLKPPLGTIEDDGELPSLSSPEPLPPEVKAFLDDPPHRGEGLNNWLIRAAHKLRPYRDGGESVRLITNALKGEPLQSGEIERAVERSRDWERDGGPTFSGGWPSVDQKRREEIVKSGATFDDLCGLSPFVVEEGVNYAESIIEALFPGDPLICVAKSIKLSRTKLKSEWRKILADMQFMVPSPMTARTGMTQDGKVSARSLTNTGPRWYLVVEQDAGNYDEQAAVLLHLANDAPLVLVVYSGGKSLHGWFPCHGQSEVALHQFMRRAVSLGADRATWTRSQLVRMPDGTRDNGQRQTVYYFNPEAV